MKTILFKFIMIAALASSLIACSRGSIDSSFLTEDENGNNNIYRSYRVDYNEQKNKTMATATFSVGNSYGTTVRLVNPASLKVNGSLAASDTDVIDGGEVSAFYLGFIFPPAWLFMGASGTTYHKTVAGKSAVFEFTDTSGSKFRDTAYVPSLQLSLPQYPSASGFTVQVYGGSYGDNMRVRISQGSISESIYAYSNTAPVTASHLAKFGPGVVEITVEVESSSSIRADNESLGGDIKTTYSFAPRRIQLR
ncbi:hypothetical protein D3C87_1038000 [compost metagenome]